MSAGDDYCPRCGEGLPTEEWCPIVSRSDSDGTLHVHTFCDDACKNAWLEGT
jgi:hypothetical protein